MFANRPGQSARRPSADLLARFKEQHFGANNAPGIDLDHVKDEPTESDHLNDDSMGHSMFDLDPTPKASAAAHFRFTPSLLDPNSTAFAAFAEQPPGYYTPTHGSSALGFQTYESVNSQTFTTDAPDSSSHSAQCSISPTSIFQPHVNPLNHTDYMHFRPHPYAQDAYQNMGISISLVAGTRSESSPSNYSPETASGADTTEPELFIGTEAHGKFMNPTIIRNANMYGQFRFATTLHAATAMLRHSNDIPVTYLNKRQAYTISVVDNSPAVQNKELKRYRTTVRIAFDEEDQRRTAPTCWRLWKDGRGTMESGGNPDKLRAIDYEPVETRAVNDKKSNSETSLQVEESAGSFDRFTFTWSTASSKPTVYFCVRFLFLSTDFSHSKGVKGVPVRLVAKTEFLGTGESTFQNTAVSELAYCKIKLFRDKGAERKLANDRQHLERAVEKLRQQAQQLINGSPDPSNGNLNKKKKRHSISGPSANEAQLGSPQRRHRRDWSISSSASASSNSGNPRSQQDEIQRKLDKANAMETMFASIRSSSAFSLIGDPADNPSLPFSPIAPQSQWEAPGKGISIAGEGDRVQRGSPALSQTSFSSVPSEKFSSPLVHPMSPPDATSRMTGIIGPSHLSQRVRVPAVTKEIDAVDVNPFYVPMPFPTIHPALCVYVIPAKIGPNGDPHTMHLPTAVDPNNDVYYAVYVPARTSNALSMAIAAKMGFDPNTIVRTTIINKRGLRLALDDEVAREMLEQQDMRIAFREVKLHPDSQQDGMSVDRRRGLELFLAF